MLLRISCVVAALVAFAVVAVPREPSPTQAPPASIVKFSKDTLTLSEVLAEMQSQTGNVIVDRRSNRDNPKLTFRSTTGKYWEMLDAIGGQGINFSAYQEGGIALVDTPHRKLDTHYSGSFRFAVKAVAVRLDHETKAHTCHVTLDTAWEPRFQLLYLNLDDAEVNFGKQFDKLDRQAARPVAGMSATEIDLAMKAPPRTVPTITELKGSIRVIGAPKMLEFAFNKLKLDRGPIVQDDVKVSLTFVNVKSPTRWTVEMLTVYPPGAIVPLESYQSWMDNNRVWLSWGLHPKTKKPYELEPTGQSPQDSSEGTKIRYEFTPRGNTPLPSINADVTLRYRTPSRVVAFTVPFEFKALPLP
jgi:hypothetical protein